MILQRNRVGARCGVLKYRVESVDAVNVRNRDAYMNAGTLGSVGAAAMGASCV